MADDSENLKKFEAQLNYHPCDTPRGSLYYDTLLLTDNQRSCLKDFKIETNREDEIYLANNPKIRAMIVLVIQHVLKVRPRYNLIEVIGSWFQRPRGDLDYEVKQYIDSREPHTYEGDSAVIPDESITEEETAMSELLIQSEELDSGEPSEIDINLYMKNLIEEKISYFSSRNDLNSEEIPITPARSSIEDTEEMERYIHKIDSLKSNELNTSDEFLTMLQGPFTPVDSTLTIPHNPMVDSKIKTKSVQCVTSVCSISDVSPII